ncbi:MAG TPA: lipid kinase, partial [Tepidisphaeraceae bacterium]
MKQRALFLTNEHSRSCSVLLEPAEAALKAAGIELHRPKLASKEDVVPTILREAPNVDRIIVMGGDGSVNTALPGVMQTGLPLGVLPAGTANDLARTLGLPKTVPEAAAVIAAGVTKPIDLADVNGHPFINAASLGLSVSITETLTKELKSRWGVLAYAIASMSAVWKTKGFGARIEIDGKTDVVRTTQIVIGNGRHFGSGMTVHETATIDDGQLDLYSVGIRSWWRLLYAFPT